MLVTRTNKLFCLVVEAYTYYARRLSSSLPNISSLFTLRFRYPNTYILFNILLETCTNDKAFLIVKL